MEAFQRSAPSNDSKRAAFTTAATNAQHQSQQQFLSCVYSSRARAAWGSRPPDSRQPARSSTQDDTWHMTHESMLKDKRRCKKQRKSTSITQRFGHQTAASEAPTFKSSSRRAPIFSSKATAGWLSSSSALMGLTTVGQLVVGTRQACGGLICLGDEKAPPPPILLCKNDPDGAGRHKCTQTRYNMVIRRGIRLPSAMVRSRSPDGLWLVHAASSRCRCWRCNMLTAPHEELHRIISSPMCRTNNPQRKVRNPRCSEQYEM